MESIKSFIYIDKERMYSLSSQLFEGLVQSFIQSEKRETNEEEKQPKPPGSGKGSYVADILTLQSEKKEDKFLHDFLYNQFEEELIKKSKIIDINEDKPESIQPYKIIKVKGRMILNDAKAMKKTIREFNNIGEAIAYMTLYTQKQELEQQADENISNTTDRNQKARSGQKKNSIMKQHITNYAKDNNLHLDKDFLEKLEYAIDFGLGDLLEVQIKFDDFKFSSILDRNCLKDSESLLVHKLSRYSEADVTLVGIVTQGSQYISENINDEDSEVDNPSFKSAMRDMIDSLVGMENTFTGKSINEVIVDPIALYLEL